MFKVIFSETPGVFCIVEEILHRLIYGLSNDLNYRVSTIHDAGFRIVGVGTVL
jgi:hypothetical protein